MCKYYVSSEDVPNPASKWEQCKRFAEWNNRKLLLEGEGFTPYSELWSAVMFDLPDGTDKRDLFMVACFNYLKPNECSIVSYDNKTWLRLTFDKK